MKNTIAFFINNPLAANLLMILIFIFGFFGLNSLRSTFFPEAQSGIIIVESIYPGASPKEVEIGVTTKIEQNIKGISGIEKVNSISSENFSRIQVRLEKGVKINNAIQKIKNSVDQIGTFPKDMERPRIYELEFLEPTIIFAITSSKYNFIKLKEIAKKIEDDLKSIDGISKISLSGYSPREIQVSINEEKLLSHKISFDEIALAIQKSNINLTGGIIKTKDENFLIRSNQKRYEATEIGNIDIRTLKNGKKLKLNEIANVEEIWQDNASKNIINGQEGIIVSIKNTTSEDILFISNTVSKYIQDFNKKNFNVNAVILFNASILLKERIDLLTENGALGFFLVIIILAFLFDMRIAFWVALSIPISFMGMFLLAPHWDVTINMLSLFGMILSIGILVDDGLIISESIYQKKEMGMTPKKAALVGTLEVFPSVLAGVGTTIIAFLTFFLIEGQLGDFGWQLAFVVTGALLFSLVEAALILPSHLAHSKALKQDFKQSKIVTFCNNFLFKIRDNYYMAFLKWTLRNKTLTLVIIIGLFYICLGAVKGEKIKLTFFPAIELNDYQVSLSLKAGTSKLETEYWLKHIEDIVIRTNDSLKKHTNKDIVLNTFISIGPNTNEGKLFVYLSESEFRETPTYEFINLTRKKIKPIPKQESLVMGMISTFGKPIAFSMLSHNKEELFEASNELKSKLINLKDATDVTDNNNLGQQEIILSLNKKGKSLGLSEIDVINQVRQRYFGYEIQKLQKGDEEIKIWLRLANSQRTSIGNLEEMLIFLNQNESYQVKEIADITLSQSQININHQNGKSEILVEAELSDQNASVSSIVSKVETNIMPEILKKYPTVSYTVEGSANEGNKTAQSMMNIMPIILVLIFALIIISFQSISQTLLIFIIMPFTFVGVCFGHFVHDIPISLLSAFGVIALIGVLVNDSIVLINTFNRYIKENQSFIKSVEKAAISRFRPIILTSLTTILGLLPIIIEKSMQAQFLIPMAISVAYGMLFATVLNLILMPLLLSLLNEFKIKFYKLVYKVDLLPEQVEPAIKNMNNEAIY